MLKHHRLAMIALFAATPAAAGPYATLDRMDETSAVGGELSYIALGAPFDDVTSLRVEGHGQYLFGPQLGAYGMVQIGHASGDGDSATALSNIEAGAFYLMPQLSGPDLSLALRGGLTLPTATDDFDSYFAGILAQQARITDLPLIYPEGLTLRLSASPIWKSGQYFARADGGLDVNLSASGDNVDPLIRLNGGGGMEFTGVGSFAIELAIAITTNGDAEDQTTSTFAFCYRGNMGMLAPYGAFVLPLDADFGNADFVLTAGLDARL